jgi:hypothetical protein
MIFGCDFEFPEDKTGRGKESSGFFLGEGCCFTVYLQNQLLLLTGAEIGVDLQLWRID